MTMRTPIGCLAAVLLLAACDDHASQTTTTGATSNATSAKEDLKRAGHDLGAAAEKAADKTGRAVVDEAKKEAHDLDVHVSTGAHDGGR